ncbi:MAG: hypothetical protein CV045_07695 [Cyanobacteria bacterium M5B4]|nr:MAG: hypothetical protein CV045_07695 [Cyanobacteria bacterium M5B4]
MPLLRTFSLSPNQLIPTITSIPALVKLFLVLICVLFMMGLPAHGDLLTDIEVLANQAISSLQQGDFASSEQLWTEILKLNPDNSAVWSNRGNVRLSQNKIEEAIADFSRSISLTPDEPDPYLNRGIAYERLKEWDKAITDYDRVLEINRQDAYAYNNRGNAYSGKGDWQRALENYDRATKLDPKFAFARANSALTRYQLGEDDRAVREIKNLIRKYPNFADMRAALTAILWHQQKRGEAESNWVVVMGLDDRYQDLDWVQNIRRWTPRLVQELGEFLTLQ